MIIVAISGGIGSGKSIVSSILRVLGYDVYDTDSEARKLMENSDGIKRRLREAISPDAVINGVIDRKTVGKIVFSDKSKLEKLNEIVHGEVRKHFMRWVKNHTSSNLVFVETALLYESGMDDLVNKVWEIFAPRELRIERVMMRNALTRTEVEARINSQDHKEKLWEPHPSVVNIVNDGITAVLPQIRRELNGLLRNCLRRDKLGNDA